jgi:regulator of replication initiation timing
MQRDLEEQVVSLADQKSGLETIVRRLQKENTALKHENQLLRVTDRMPSLSARLVEVQGERDSYQREYQSLLIEVDLIKARREAELASIFGICNLFEKKIEEITANLQSTRDV